MARRLGSQDLENLNAIIGLTFSLAGYAKSANELQSLGEYCGQLRDDATARDLKARGFARTVEFTENGADLRKVDFIDEVGKPISDKSPEQIDAWLRTHGDYQDDPRWKRHEIVRTECDRYASLLVQMFEILCQCPSMEDVAVAFRFVPDSAHAIPLHERSIDWAAFDVDVEMVRNSAGKVLKRAAITARRVRTLTKPPMESRGPKFKRPVKTAEAARKLNVRSDTLLKTLRVRKYPIGGSRGAFVAELEHVIAVYPKRRAALLEWAEKNYPAN